MKKKIPCILVKTGCLIIASLAFISFSEAQPQFNQPNPQARPAPKIEFLGHDYARNGYTLNPGEEFYLLFRNSTDREHSFPVRWTLKTYSGKSISSGESKITLKPGATGKINVDLPAEMQDGPYSILYTPETEGWQGTHPYYFDYRKPVQDKLLNLNLVAFMENMDTEGWARMMLGPLARYCNVMNDFPEDLASVNAAVVISEALDFFNPRFARLQEYVRKGGAIIVFGKTAPILSAMLPVAGSSELPDKGKPLYLKPVESGPWQDFNPGEGFLHYPVKVKAKEGSTVLANWSDGSPAVVSGNSGHGKVIYVSTGSYQVWQDNKSLAGADEMLLRLLYNIKGGMEAVQSMLLYAENTYKESKNKDIEIRDRVFEGLKIKRPDEFVVISKNNIGRFGWVVNEGGLTENIGTNSRVSTVGTQDWAMRGGSPMMSDPRFTFSLDVAGDRSPKSTGIKQSWFAKSVEWQYNNGEKIISTLSLGSPAIMWEGTSQEVGITGSNFTSVAYPSRNGIRILKPGEKINPADMSENWLLTFFASDSVRDMPQLIVLTKRPQEISFEKGLNFKYIPGGFGAIFTSRLYGIKRLAPGYTLGWKVSIPEQTIRDARLWSQIMIKFPVDCDEIGWIENNTVRVADKLHFKSFQTDWKTKPVTITAIPPVYLLAKSVGAPVHLPEGMTDLNCPTKYGPLKAVKGDLSVINITMPPLDHRAIVPVEGRMSLSDAINRNVRGIGLNSLVYNDNVRNPGAGGTWDEDLTPYDFSHTVPYYEAPQIDLYKWWLVFNAILARPIYGESVKKEVDRHFTTRYWETLNFYPHKSLVVQKREPFTGVEYMVTFVWPTQTNLGYRNFNDINEASGVNVYCYTNYARYYGDWTTLKANWNLCRELHDYLAETQDWACMSSGALEYWNVAGLDMLNSEPFGSLSFGYAAAFAGQPEDALRGKIYGTRSLIPTVARLGLQSYLSSISSEGDPWLSFQGFEHFNEMGMQLGKRKFGSVGWLNTSKGAMHELALGYKMWAPGAMDNEQKALARASSNSLSDLTMRLFLGWNRDSLLSTASSGGRLNQEPRGFNSATELYDMAVLCVGNIPVFLSDWAPAEYISGNYDKDKKVMNLAFRSQLGDPYTVRIYSQYQPAEMKVNGETNKDTWSYDPKTGWMIINLKGDDEKRLQISFGKEVAPLHPYFTKIGE